MKEQISPEMATRYAINLTQTQTSGLTEIMYLMEDPRRIKGSSH